LTRNHGDNFGLYIINTTYKMPELKKSPSSTFEWEFGGPIGAFATTVSLPAVVLCLAHFAAAGAIDFGFLRTVLDTNSSASWQSKVAPIICPHCDIDEETNHVNWKPLLWCLIGIVTWFLFQVILERLLPARIVQGTPLPTAEDSSKKLNDNGKGMPIQGLDYRLNGHLAFWVTCFVLLSCYPHFVLCPFLMYDQAMKTMTWGMFPLEILHEYYIECATTSIGFSIALSIYMYLHSFKKGALLAHGGNSGNVAYDFFMGRELNPRFQNCNFDWKEFCELRPGLIGWGLLLNGGMAMAQLKKTGSISGSMILVSLFQVIYVWDALYQERAILTTMDITTDGFGYMLVFGDLTWVPFTYSLQAKYLVDFDPQLSKITLAMILALHIVGYIIFRGANGQKDRFRRDSTNPSLSHLKYMQTKRGTKLLISGWWGLARKINYTGDWIMGMSWCLVCGFDSIVPYYYAIYFAILLVHRSIRDDKMCHQKYGHDWLEYKKKVPYRFIPGIF
jgi:delta14-sterol reductase